MPCSDCKFFEEDDDSCRAHPPTLLEHNMEGRWPTVDSDDWCGEWQGVRSDLNSFGNPIDK